MSHFNRIINSMLRGCIQIDGQFLIFILSRQGYNSEPPTETFSDLEENFYCVHKYKILLCFGFFCIIYLQVFIIIIWSRNQSPVVLELMRFLPSYWFSLHRRNQTLYPPKSIYQKTHSYMSV